MDADEEGLSTQRHRGHREDNRQNETRRHKSTKRALRLWRPLRDLVPWCFILRLSFLLLTFLSVPSVPLWPISLFFIGVHRCPIGGGSSHLRPSAFICVHLRLNLFVRGFAVNQKPSFRIAARITSALF